MLKKSFFLLFLSTSVFANLGPIHVTTIQSSWCGNLQASTKVGTLSESGQCIYKKETSPEGFDNCDPLDLNGAYLEINAGTGFNCAATHVHSNETGHDGFDEFKLIVDKNGHYMNTQSSTGNINLG